MKNTLVNECISIEDTKQLLTTKNQVVKILDVRSREEFDLTHIPGAINIVSLAIEMVAQLFDKSDYLITACGKGGGRSTEAAEKLQTLGFKNATWLCGGTFGWIENNK